MSENHALQETAARGEVVPAEPTSGVVFTPRVDVLETDDEVLLVADLPGVRPEDCDLHLDRGELVLQGRCPPRQYGASGLLREYEVGDFYRTFTLGEHLDAGRITAELKEGVLTVRLPKADTARPRRIAIKGA